MTLLSAAARTIAGLAAAALLPSVALAQSETLTPVGEPPQPEARAEGGEDWHAFSRSTRLVYLADVGTLAEAAGVTTVRIARVPREAPTDDFPHYEIETYEFRCPQNQARSLALLEYGAGDAELSRHDEVDPAWEAVPTDGFLRYLWAIACDRNRNSERSWPSIRTFIDAGAPSA